MEFTHSNLFSYKNQLIQTNFILKKCNILSFATDNFTNEDQKEEDYYFNKEELTNKIKNTNVFINPMQQECINTYKSIQDLKMQYVSNTYSKSNTETIKMINNSLVLKKNINNQFKSKEFDNYHYGTGSEKLNQQINLKLDREK